MFIKDEKADYRIQGRDRYKQMTLRTFEFIRRFLIHVLPKGLHRIRHYGLFAKGSCADNIARARELLATSNSQSEPTSAAADYSKPSCPCCGGRMIVIEVFARGTTPRHQPTAPNLIRRHPPLIRQPLHLRTTCWIGSIQISLLARGSQIPIVPTAPPYVP